MAVTESDVLAALRPIVDPDFGKSIVELGFVKGIAIEGPRVAFTIELTTPACPVKAEFQRAAEERVRALPGVAEVAVTMTANTRGRAVGPQQALEWVMTGRVFPAEDALAGRLVRSIHKPEALLPAAYALAREIADNTAPVSVALNRHMIWKMLGADHPMEAHKVDSKGIYARGKSADVKEGVVAFLEKRPAKFPMKVSDGMPSYFPWWKERQFRE